MKKMTFTAIAFTIFFSVQLIIPNQSEAGTTCKTDWLGNYVCTDTSGNSSTTKTDWLGNDNTTFSNGDTMSCKTDWLGNYVCN
jgi:hypothetical protein